MEQRTQWRGVCQCCGREQAVVKGRMAKHGYTVDNGWFQGVCTGQYFEPMQYDIKQTVEIVKQIRTEIALLTIRLAAVHAGTLKPEFTSGGQRFEDASEYTQNYAVRMLEHALENRISSGEYAANELERLATLFHGQPLERVTITPPPVICCGEKRKGPRGVMTVHDVHGGRVYWTDERGFKSWTGSGAWRKFELV